MSYSFVSVYWSQEKQKPLTSNVIINNSGEFDKVVYSLSKIKLLNNYDNIYNTLWINSNHNTLITNSNVIIGSNTNNSLAGNFLIQGNITPFNSNFNLGSNGYGWKYLYGNSIYINDISVKTSNNSIYIPSTISTSNMELNSLLFKLSNNELLFQSNGANINTIDFKNYQMIIYSNNLYANSNFLINDLIYKLNNLFTTDTIPLGINNQFITNGNINSNITFTKNLNVTKSYNFKGFNVPFEFSNSIFFFKGDIKGSNIIDLNYENEFTINQKLAPILLNLNTTSNNYISYKNKRNINWNTNNSNIFINKAVGIGNTTPTTALDVIGDINFTQNLKINNIKRNLNKNTVPNNHIDYPIYYLLKPYIKDELFIPRKRIPYFNYRHYKPIYASDTYMIIVYNNISNTNFHTVFSKIIELDKSNYFQFNN